MIGIVICVGLQAGRSILCSIGVLQSSNRESGAETEREREREQSNVCICLCV
jgi:hypothetical protein